MEKCKGPGLIQVRGAFTVIKTNAVASNSPCTFQVKIANSDSAAMTCTLVAGPDSQAGWKRTYLLGNLCHRAVGLRQSH